MNKRKRLVSILAGIMAAIMILSLLLSIIPAPASAASSSEIKKQINEMKNEQNELKSQMAEVQSQYAENEDEIANMVNKKLIIDQEIFLLHQQIDVINQQLAAYALLIADKQDELDAATERMSQLSEKNRERIRAMEEDGTLSYWSVLFKAHSFVDLLDRLAMIQEIAAADQRRLNELNLAAEAVAAARNDLVAEKEELDMARSELNEANQVLLDKNAEAQALIDELVAQGFELQELYAQFEEMEKELLADIAQKEKEYQDAKEQEWIAHMATATTPPTTAPATKPTEPPVTEGEATTNPGKDEGGIKETEPEKETEPPTTEPPATEPESNVNSDPWRVPCSYTKLTSPFGEREQPTEGASTNHQGVDLAGPEGTPIYASRGGKVTIAKFSNSAGYYVTINHGDGYSSIYMHMTRYVVAKGDTVTGGQLIGYMGSTGISTGPHLHWGIMYNGSYVNPANYVYLHP